LQLGTDEDQRCTCPLNQTTGIDNEQNAMLTTLLPRGLTHPHRQWSNDWHVFFHQTRCENMGSNTVYIRVQRSIQYSMVTQRPPRKYISLPRPFRVLFLVQIIILYIYYVGSPVRQLVESSMSQIITKNILWHRALFKLR